VDANIPGTGTDLYTSFLQVEQWANTPPLFCSYYRGVAWNTAAGSNIAFGYTTRLSDRAGMYNMSTGVCTIPQTGLWLINEFMFISSTAAGQSLQIANNSLPGGSGTQIVSSVVGQVMTSTYTHLNILNSLFTFTTAYTCSTAGLGGGTGQNIFFQAYYIGPTS
jgi:hypothetical protein